MAPFRGKILVIRGGAIGDFILTLPAIAALRRQFPEACLEVLGYPHIVQLAQVGQLVNYVRSIEARALAGFFARNGTLAEELVDFFSEFDLIVSYLYDPDGIFRANVGRCTVAQFVVGPHRPDESAQVPAAKVFLQPLEQLAIFEADPVPRLTTGRTGWDAAHRSAAGRVLPGNVLNRSHTLALHPGSGSEHKNWPESRWADLLEQLIGRTALNLLLVGGEAEGERLQRLAATLHPARTAVAQSLPLAELAGLLEACSAFVGHDSGISHLAAAVGLPGLVLWGDTAEAIWRPPSEKVTVLRHPAGLARLDVGQVLVQIRRICSG